MSHSESKEIESIIRELVAKLYLYIKGGNISSSEIVSLLNKLIEHKEFSNAIISNKLLALNLFKELRKYIPVHIDRINISLNELFLKTEMPVYILRWLYETVYKGKLKITTLVFVPGLTIKTIQKGLRKLRAKSVVPKIGTSYEELRNALLKRTLAYTNFLGSLAKQELSRELLSIMREKDILGISSDFLIMSEREFTNRLLAILKFSFNGESHE